MPYDEDPLCSDPYCTICSEKRRTMRPPDGPFDIRAEWEKWFGTGRWVFPLANQLREFESYAAKADYDVTWCIHCHRPVMDDDDDRLEINGEFDVACGDCARDYVECEDCGEITHSDDLRYTGDDRSICDGCIDMHYSYCDACDAYFHLDEGHDTSHSCDCESAQKAFRMPNDGDGMLANDTRATVTLPKGVIGQEGLLMIRRRLMSEGLYGAEVMVGTIGDEWQTREGNFPKRLSRAVHKYDGSKIPPQLLSDIGNIARDHSNTVSINSIEVTRELNLSAAAFAHAESCYWGSYSESRCTLKNNGGFGIRTFNNVNFPNDVTGRVWVFPMNVIGEENPDGLVPVLDVATASAYIVFNGYGDLSGYTAARLVSHMAGMTYRKVRLDISPMYINGDSGYIVSSQEIVDRFAERGVSLSLDHHEHLLASA